MGRYIAVDIGATNGRVALVDTSKGNFDISMVHRFRHEVIESPDGNLYWNWEHIVEESIKGIRAAAALGAVTSLAIDTWAADYGFLDSQSQLLPPIFSYRDARGTKGPSLKLSSPWEKREFFNQPAFNLCP